MRGLAFVCSLALVGQATNADASVRLIQRPIQDAPDVQRGFLQGGVRIQDFNGASGFVLGADGTLRLAQNAEIGARVGWARIDVDGGSDQSGLLDPEIFARFLLAPIETPAGNYVLLAFGGALSLPAGEALFFEGTIDLEAFGAMRYETRPATFVGRLALRVNGDPEIDVPDLGTVTIPAQPSVLLGGGILVDLSPFVTLTGELDIETARIDGGASDVRLTPGLDVLVGEGGHIRGGLGLGLSDGAPDLEVLLGGAVDF